MTKNVPTSTLEELYEVKKQYEFILENMGADYFSDEQHTLVNDAIVVLACISDSPDSIDYADRMIIELLFPLIVENENQNMYRTIRKAIKPEQLEYFEVGTIATARERNAEGIETQCVKFLENLGRLYFKIVPPNPEKQKYFEKFIGSIKNNNAQNVR